MREETIATDWSGNINDSTTITDYQKVIGSLINDSKQFVESHHDWLALRETFTITTISGSMQYILGDLVSGAGTNFKVLDVINRDTGRHLTQVNNTWLNAKSFPIANIATGEPMNYAMNGSTVVVDNRVPDMNVDLYPVPVSSEGINFNVIKTQGQLKGAADIVYVPIQPVVLGGWARAVAERGEDGGSGSSMIAQEAMESLKNAVIIDSGNAASENDWYAV